MAEKPPPHKGIFLTADLSISCAISSNFGFVADKAPPPPQMRENFLTSQIYPFQAMSQATFIFVAEKPPP